MSQHEALIAVVMMLGAAAAGMFWSIRGVAAPTPRRLVEEGRHPRD